MANFIQEEEIATNHIQNKLPLVNIITVTYNAKSDLEKTILSVLSEDYPRINYIIIDGGSNDGTSEMVEKYKAKINYYITEKDNGIYDAMNKGMTKVKEGYLNFLNAGDEYISTRTISSIFKNTGDKYDLVYGKIIVGEVTEEKLKNPQETKDFTRENILAHGTSVLCHQAIFLKKEKAPLYDASYKIKGDVEWYLKILDRNSELSSLKSDVIVIKYKGGGISEKRYFLDAYETGKLILKRFGIILFFRFGYHKIIAARIFRETKKHIKSIFS